MVASKHKAPTSRQITLRHAWLAGLGLAVVVRRETAALAQRLLGNTVQPGAPSPPREVVARKVAPARERPRAGLAAPRKRGQSR